MKIESTKDIAIKNIKVLVHGPSGAGKTRLCATTGGKALIISVEGGLLSLADYDIDVVEVKTIEQLQDVYVNLVNDTTYDWVCLDSISEIAEVVLANEKAKNKDPRKAYGEMQDRMMSLMRSFRDLPKNIYFSAKQETIKDDITGGLLFGPSAPGQKIGPAMPYMFDFVFALQTWKDDAGDMQRALQTQRDSRYEAKDRGGKLDFAEPPSLEHIYKKVTKPKTSKQTKGE